MLIITLTYLVALAWFALCWEGWRGRRSLVRLEQVSPLSDAERRSFPFISVVIAARNEERTIRQGLLSLLQQDYPCFEIIVVDDRSEDATANVLREMLESAPPGRLKVIENKEHPTGWLGKCHALHLGAQVATGEYLLFTDADVVFAPDVLRRAARLLVSERVDMLCVFPRMIVRSLPDKLFVAAFAQLFFFAFRPWRAMQRRSNAFVGVGAFNLVRKSLYQRFGGHRLLRLKVVDDVALGKLVKYSGGRVLVAQGGSLLSVRWQDSLWGFIRGVEKNAFAGMRFSVFRTVGVAVALLCLYWGPWVTAWVGSSPSLTVVAWIACSLQILACVATCIELGFSWTLAPLVPLGVGFVMFALLRSMILTLKRGGVVWRDDFYSIAELRRFWD